jgi:hypothetical protein
VEIDSPGNPDSPACLEGCLLARSAKSEPIDKPEVPSTAEICRERPYGDAEIARIALASETATAVKYDRGVPTPFAPRL